MKAKLIAICLIALLFSCKKEGSNTNVLLLQSYKNSSLVYADLSEHMFTLCEERAAIPIAREKLEELRTISNEIAVALIKTKTLNREELPGEI